MTRSPAPPVELDVRSPLWERVYLVAPPVLACLHPGRCAETAAAYSFPIPQDMRR